MGFNNVCKLSFWRQANEQKYLAFWHFRLFEQLERLHDLEEEKATISEHAHDLQSTIQV